MSSKRKGQGRLKEVARQDAKFVNDEALERYESLRSMPLIFERGLIMEMRGWSLPYSLHTATLQWETFCHPRTEAVLPWVFEFYANAIGMEREKVMVRGKFIDISADTINDFFELAHDDHYATLSATIDPTDLVPVICNSLEPEWSRKPMKAMKSTSLSREAKVWLLFINASLMPTRHLNDVTYDRLVIIYYILKGIRFNVGEVISTSIKRNAWKDKTKQLWFPTLITSLCRRFGVEFSDGDMLTPVTKHITEHVAKVNIKVAGALEGGKENTGEGSKLKRIRIPSGEGATLKDIADSIEFVKVYQKCQFLYVKSRQDHMQKQLDLLLRKAKIPVEDAIFEFQSQFDAKGSLLDEDGDDLDPTLFEDNNSSNDNESEEEGDGNS